MTTDTTIIAESAPEGKADPLAVARAAFLAAADAEVQARVTADSAWTAWQHGVGAEADWQAADLAARQAEAATLRTRAAYRAALAKGGA